MEIENPYNEKTRLDALVTEFKSNNNKEYLKIKQEAEEKVIDVLTNGKLFLEFATASVIESLRLSPEQFNLYYIIVQIMIQIIPMDLIIFR